MEGRYHCFFRKISRINVWGRVCFHVSSIIILYQQSCSHYLDNLKLKVTRLAFGREANSRGWSWCLYARLRNASNEGRAWIYRASWHYSFVLVLTTFSPIVQTDIGAKLMNKSKSSQGGGEGNTLYLWQCLALFPYCCLHWSSTVNVTPGISVGNSNGLPSAWVLKHLLALELREKTSAG